MRYAMSTFFLTFRLFLRPLRLFADLVYCFVVAGRLRYAALSQDLSPIQAADSRSSIPTFTENSDLTEPSLRILSRQPHSSSGTEISAVAQTWSHHLHCLLRLIADSVV